MNKFNGKQLQHEIITKKRLHELLNYNPESGMFTWKLRTSNRVPVGSRAGKDNGNGYWRLNADKYSYYAHQLAWLYIYGEWPDNEIDHIDGNGLNNKISNLRRATHAQNSQNLSLRNTNKSGMTGVSWMKSYGKWESYITANYKKINLGYYDDLQKAGEAYLAAKQEMHQFQPVPRCVVRCQ